MKRWESDLKVEGLSISRGRTWFFRFRVQGRQHSVKIGDVQDLPLKEARAEAQKMVLDSIGEQRVSFVAASSGGLKKLGYTLTETGQFLIEVTTAEDQEMTLPLAAMQR